MTTDLGPPIDVLQPDRRGIPLVVSSPHSGQIYPSSLLSAIAVSPAELRRLEDGCVDRLFDWAPGLGAPLLRARFARAYVDPNREACELDPELIHDALPLHANVSSAKARAGLGTIPSRIGGRPIYGAGLSLAEADRRMRLAYWPYHHALERLLAESLSQFGAVLLLDCHSMPRLTANGSVDGGAIVDVALGDRYGRSCAGEIIAHAEQFLRRHGLNVTRNRPYAGGHITTRYGRPDAGMHALQIEIRRDLYMDEHSLRPHAELERVRSVIRACSLELAALVSRSLVPPAPLVDYPTAS